MEQNKEPRNKPTPMIKLRQEARIYKVENSLQVVLGKLDSHTYINKVRTHLTPHPKINSKWLKDIRHDIIKLEENLDNLFSDINQHFFLRSVPQVNRNESKNKQMGPNQTLQTFAQQIETYKLLHSKQTK